MLVDIGWKYGTIPPGKRYRSAVKIDRDEAGLIWATLLNDQGTPLHVQQDAAVSLPLGYRLELGVYESLGLTNTLSAEICDLEVDRSRLNTEQGWTHYGTSDYGVADDVAQILEYERDRRIGDPDQLFVLEVSNVLRADQPAQEGWRWTRWGTYIGTRTPT